MSEQEMDLDEAIQLFDLVETFDEYEEGLREVLTRVHTQEELDRARAVIDEKKQDLMDNNPEFNDVMEQRKLEAKQRAEYDQAIHKARMAEAEAKASMARSEALAKGRMTIPDSDMDAWVARTKFKTVDFEELEKQSKEALWCPICQKLDKNNNIINNKPSCATCFHQLVRKSELKDYPRKYRRAWKKKGKTF